jgi:hypothetical protein
MRLHSDRFNFNLFCISQSHGHVNESFRLIMAYEYWSCALNEMEHAFIEKNTSIFSTRKLLLFDLKKVETTTTHRKDNS